MEKLAKLAKMCYYVVNNLLTSQKGGNMEDNETEGRRDDINRIVYAYDSDSTIRQARAMTPPMSKGKPLYDIVGNLPQEG